jgi:hypothetical protein
VFGVFTFLLALSVGGFEFVHLHGVFPYHLEGEGERSWVRLGGSFEFRHLH